MQYRDLEHITGNGKLYCDNEFICNAGYDFKIFQEMIPALPGQPYLEGLTDISGYLTGEMYDFFDLVGKTVKVNLEDGRCLECIINMDGSIISMTGQGLYRP